MKKGFTLLEILVVVIIIGSLTTIYLLNSNNPTKETEAKKNVVNEKSFESVLFEYMFETRSLPVDQKISDFSKVSTQTGEEIKKKLQELNVSDIDKEYEALKTNFYTISKEKIIPFGSTRDIEKTYFLIGEKSKYLAGYAFSYDAILMEKKEKRVSVIAPSKMVVLKNGLDLSGFKDASVASNSNFSPNSKAKTLVIKGDGTLWGWGDNSDNVISPGSETYVSTPVQIGTDSDWKQVFATYYNGIAIKENGDLYAWGKEGTFETSNLTIQKTPNKRKGVTNIKTIVGKEKTFFILNTNGDIYRWGQKLSIFDLTVDPKGENVDPLLLEKETNKWKMISYGIGTSPGFITGIKEDGTLHAIGRSASGEIGVAAPVGYQWNQVSPDADWKFVTSGYYSSIAIKNDGSLWYFGQDIFCAPTSTTCKKTITLLDNTQKWESASINVAQIIAKTTDGDVWIFGRRAKSNAARFNTDVELIPWNNRQLLLPSIKWKTITTSDTHGIGISQDNKIYTWGANNSGEIGDGTTTFSLSPKIIAIP